MQPPGSFCRQQTFSLVLAPPLLPTCQPRTYKIDISYISITVHVLSSSEWLAGWLGISTRSMPHTGKAHAGKPRNAGRIGSWISCSGDPIAPPRPQLVQAVQPPKQGATMRDDACGGGVEDGRYRHLPAPLPPDGRPRQQPLMSHRPKAGWCKWCDPSLQHRRNRHARHGRASVCAMPLSNRPA